MKTIYVFLAEGFEEIEALTPVDVLRRAGLSVKTVSVMDKYIVTGAHGVPVLADVMFDEVNAEDAEMILLPGGLPGATNLDAHQGLSQMILDFAKEEKPLAAICAAPLALEAAGVIKDRRVTCYPSVKSELVSAAEVCDCPAVTDGNIVTGRGPGAALEFGFELGRYFGKSEEVEKLRSDMCCC